MSTAVDGNDALRRIEHDPFDVILLDVMMPGMSGLEVLREIRRTQSASELPIIMATARGESQDIVEGSKWGPTTM